MKLNNELNSLESSVKPRGAADSGDNFISLFTLSHCFHIVA